jgi:hypothetical protein
MTPIPKKKTDGLKTGCNKLDQMKIAKMSADGKTASEISKFIKVNIDSVKSFMPKKKKKAVKKED